MTAGVSSHQQRRRALLAVLAEGRKVLARGLPNPAPQSALIGVGLVIAEPLSNGGSEGASRAAALSLRLASVMIDGIARREAPACHRGCDHCCHFAISASAPEILHLARTLRYGGAAAAPIIDRIAARRSETAGMGLEALMAQSLPCPMLSDGVCGAYAARPIVCRQFMSRSAEACGAARAGQPTEIPTLRGAINAGVLGRSLLLAAVRAHGLDGRCYEVTSALQIALQNADSERRWLAGEDVFAAALVAARPPEAEAMVEHLANDMRTIAGIDMDARGGEA